MDLHTWTLYFGVATVLIVTPGPAAVLCVQHGLRHGGRRSLATVFGGTLSAFVLMSLSAFGLSSLIAATPLGFEIAQALGAAWLVLLGVRAWRVGRHMTPPPTLVPAAHRMSLAALCRDGFLLGVSNPKDLLFFGALLPQFLDPQAPQLPQLAVLFATWAVVDGLAMGGYAALGQRLQHWLDSPLRMQQFQRASGALLIGAGTLLALSRGS